MISSVSLAIRAGASCLAKLKVQRDFLLVGKRVVCMLYAIMYMRSKKAAFVPSKVSQFDPWNSGSAIKTLMSCIPTYRPCAGVDFDEFEPEEKIRKAQT